MQRSSLMGITATVWANRTGTVETDGDLCTFLRVPEPTWGSGVGRADFLRLVWFEQEILGMGPSPPRKE